MVFTFFTWYWHLAHVWGFQHIYFSFFSKTVHMVKVLYPVSDGWRCMRDLNKGSIEYNMHEYFIIATRKKMQLNFFFDLKDFIDIDKRERDVSNVFAPSLWQARGYFLMILNIDSLSRCTSKVLINHKSRDMMLRWNITSNILLKRWERAHAFWIAERLSIMIKRVNVEIYFLFNQTTKINSSQTKIASLL